MNRSLSRFAFALLVLAATVSAGIAARALVSSPKEGWLEAEAPPIAARGRAFTILVRPKRAAGDLYLKVDLHILDAAKGYRGYAAGAPAERLVPGQAEYRFELEVPDRADAAYVQGIIYLSRNGDWRSRTASARLESMPIAISAPSEDELRPRKVAAYPVSDRYEPARVDSFPFELLAAAAWAACAIVCLLKSRDGRSAAMAIACLAACLWELAMPEPAISDLFRSLFRLEGLYSERKGPQILVSFAVLAAGLVGAALIPLSSIKAGRAHRGLAWLCLYAYAGIALLRIVSEHGIDALFALRVAGMQAGQAARLCCALLCAALLFVGEGRASGRKADQGRGQASADEATFSDRGSA